MGGVDKLLEWVWASFVTWEYLRYGFFGALLLSGAAYLWSLWRPQDGKLPWYIPMFIGVFALFIGSFSAWYEKDRQLQLSIAEKQQLIIEGDRLTAEKDRLLKLIDDRKPRLVGGQYSAFCTPSGVAPILFYIKNVGGSPSIARDFKLALSNTERYAFLTPGQPDTFITHPLGFNDMEFIVRTQELIQRKSMIKAIAPGDEIRGWLFASVPDIDPNPNTRCSKLQNAMIEFKDNNEVQYAVPIRQLTLVPPLPDTRSLEHEGFVDVLYPFRHKKDIETLIEKERRALSR